VRIFYGQGGGVFRCGRPHFFDAKKLRIFRNLCCVRTDKGGFEPVRTRGSVSRDFVRTSFWTAPNAFDGQEQNLIFVKTDFQVLKLKFLACSIKPRFLSSSQTKYCASLTTTKHFFYNFSVRYVVVKPACVNILVN